MNRSLISLVSYFIVMPLAAQESTPEARGKKALEGKSFIQASWRASAYDNVWKQWGDLKEKPQDYDRLFRERYGLHPAPYANNGLPMGLRSGSIAFLKGIAVDCMVCHGGSIFGKSYVGLGNTSLDIESLFSELGIADGTSGKMPFHFANVRGTSEAAAMSVYLLGYREPNLDLHRPRRELGLHDEMCEDVPAWWHLKKKKTMYYTGGADARSVRSKMQFMMTPLNTLKNFEDSEKDFQDIQAYMLTLEAPKYPLSINSTLAEQGRELFQQNCASCHGTYGKHSTYPNKIIPLEKIGTDSKRFEGVTEAFGKFYNQSWFAKEKKGWFFDGSIATVAKGYQAPPLDGIWATAPYLHNGSVPTLYHVLKSSARPRVFTRSYKTNEEDYDTVKVGWKYNEVNTEDSLTKPKIEQRKIYDTNQPGRTNQGHSFGDDLTEEERMAVIEYLKTL